ncbi:BRISC and BRCA1-A complex member 1-like [Antedon mediterranea]|uniref:BRISC and BRCA1-A complex member 1-like n=1 Tax=Antedon mediterranea TaxID=105859 RepID=UPI003AF8FB8F
MSEKSGTNPFLALVKEEENLQRSSDLSVKSNINERSKDEDDPTNENVEYSTAIRDSPYKSLGPSKSGSTGAHGRTETSGLNPFLAVDPGLELTEDDSAQVTAASAQQKAEESKEVELSFGPQLPKVNCKEKIVICFDLSSEVDNVPFVGRDGTQFNSSSLIQNVLHIFIQTKNAINANHEFALVVLQEKAIWYQDFTNDCSEFIDDLYDLNAEKQDCEEFDMSSLFETLHENVTLPTVENELLPPPYIVRTIMIYGRSKCIPTFGANKEICQYFLKSPYFFMDVFYIHEAPAEENKCKEVYDVFLDMDEMNRAYINEVGKNITQLHDKMAMFLAHPLQRPYQQHCQYTVKDTPEEL